MSGSEPRGTRRIKHEPDQESIAIVHELLALRRMAQERQPQSAVFVVTTTRTKTVSVSTPTASNISDSDRQKMVESITKSLAAAAAAAAAAAKDTPSITAQEIEMARCISLMAARKHSEPSPSPAPAAARLGAAQAAGKRGRRRKLPSAESSDVEEDDDEEEDGDAEGDARSRSLSPPPGRGKWTTEEDAMLQTAVRELGDAQWKEVARRVGSRSASQCLHRWKYSLQPCISRAKWTAEEDVRLVEAVQKFGAHWSLIAQMMGTRTGAQCRERYCNKLDPQIYRGHWSAGEDQMLLRIVAEVGNGRWAQVSKQMTPPRTDYQVRKRWFLLQRRLRQGGSIDSGASSPSVSASPALSASQSPAIAAPMAQRAKRACISRRASVVDEGSDSSLTQADAGLADRAPQVPRLGRAPARQLAREQ